MASTSGDNTSRFPDLSEQVAELVGQPTGPPEIAMDPVNRSMIRHWVEAMGDTNPVYASDAAAHEVGLPGTVAPPTMLQAWTMRGLAATLGLEDARRQGAGPGSSVYDRLTYLLDQEGRTSVVATNCEQQYERPLRLGERLVSRAVIESVSEDKRTALGDGRFVTTRADFVAVDDDLVHAGADPVVLMDEGEPVATMRFRILKFRPSSSAGTGSAGADDGRPARPRRPRPALTQDNAFFFEGAARGKLLIQRCTACGTLRHPPLPACGRCRSLDWDTVEASGRAHLYSYVVVHHPQVASFDYPMPIALVELEEGTRLVANLEDVDLSELRIGMPVEVRFVALDHELVLPVFHPAGVDPVPRHAPPADPGGQES